MSSLKFRLACAFLALAAFSAAQANNTPHDLAGGNFSQDWSNAGLITANDDWSSVPSIVGFRGDGLTGATGTDPQTLTADDATGVIDVNANQTDPVAFNTGGATEFALANPTVALAGSATADAPYLLIHLNATGRCSINVSYNVRDLDSSADDATQQLALHFRTAASGVFTNVGAAYVADGTTANAATQVTTVGVALPVGAENQSTLQLRIMSTNAAGNDEPVGIDDINISSSACAGPVPNLSINDVSLAEGDAGTTAFTFTVSLDAPAPAGGVTFDIATADDTAISSGVAAAGGADFATQSLTSQTIPETQQTYDFIVTVNGDTVYEPNTQQFFVNVANVTGATVTDAQGQGTINDDDSFPQLTATAAISVTEGLSGTTPANIVYTLSNSADMDTTINLHTNDGTAMTADNDYNAVMAGQAMIPAGDTSVMYSDATVNGDAIIETDETFQVIVDGYDIGLPPRAPVGIILPPPTVVTITNDDALPLAFQIDNVTVTETDAGGLTADFTVTLATVMPPLRAPDGGTIASVEYTTVVGTASTADFTASSGTLNFVAAGTQTISVPITGDLLDEGQEQFTVVLSNPAGATISDDTGLGTIDDNDGAPTLSINDVVIVEGNGSSNASLTVTLSAASSFTVTATAATADGTATLANNDYTTTTTPLSFAPGGALTQTVLVPIVGDSVVEANETLFVNLSTASNATILDDQGQITITNDDAAADLSVTITDTPDPVLPGGLLTYTVTLTNSGPSNADNASFSLPLPANTTFNSLMQPGGWNCTTPAVGANGAVSCNDSNFRALVSKSMTPDKLAPGSAMFTIVVTVDALTTPGTLLNTEVTASSTTFDPTPANNAITGSTTVGGGSNNVPTAPIPALDRFGQLLAALMLMAIAALALRPRSN